MPYFISYLKMQLAQRKVKQCDLAKIIGCGESTVSNYLRGERKPSHEDLSLLLTKLHTNPVERNAALVYCYFGA